MFLTFLQLLLVGRVVVMQEERLSKCRNWQEYNETLVKRGEMYLTFDFLEHWDKDLEKLNRDARAEICVSVVIYRAINVDPCYLSSALSSARRLCEEAVRVRS